MQKDANQFTTVQIVLHKFMSSSPNTRTTFIHFEVHDDVEPRTWRYEIITMCFVRLTRFDKEKKKTKENDFD